MDLQNREMTVVLGADLLPAWDVVETRRPITTYGCLSRLVYK